jgi:hypothetical protein
VQPLNENLAEKCRRAFTSLQKRFRQQIEDQLGQSLVEVAIFLPILIFILAGIVEVGNVLITQNRVTTSARVAAGYGAARYDRDDWNGTAMAMGNVSLNTVTETMKLSPDLWDIWAIRALTNDAGDGFEEFEATHVFGTNSVVSTSEWTTIETQVQSDMLAELQSQGAELAKDLEVVASLNYHNIDTILGLDLWQWVGFQRLKGLTVMRVGEREPYVGCPLLPIAVRFNQYSAYPSNWPDIPLPGSPMQLNATHYPGDPVSILPAGNGPTGFEYPVPAPVYFNEATAPALRTNSFDLNWPGVPLSRGETGYIYWAREEGPNGSFGWLSWQPPASAIALRDSLTYPGNFLDHFAGYVGGPADMGLTGDPPGADTGDEDGLLEVGEWVENSTGNISSAEGIIQGYVNSGTPVTIIITDQTNGLTGSNANYRVAGFVSVEIVGYSFQGPPDSKWILFKFVEWGKECKSPG